MNEVLLRVVLVAGSRTHVNYLVLRQSDQIERGNVTFRASNGWSVKSGNQPALGEGSIYIQGNPDYNSQIVQYSCRNPKKVIADVVVALQEWANHTNGIKDPVDVGSIVGVDGVWEF